MEDTPPLHSLSVLLKQESCQLKPCITGVVTVTVKKVNGLGVWSMNTNCYVNVNVRTVSKQTSSVLVKDGRGVFNQTKNLPVQLVHDPRNVFNWVRLDVCCVDTSGQRPTHVFGSCNFHLHDIVRVAPVDNVFDLYHGDRSVGEIHLVIQFAYGLFGYGYSPQQLSQKSIEDNLRQSLYPRVPPPSNRETERCVLIPQAISHPSFIPFAKKVHFNNGSLFIEQQHSNEDSSRMETLEAGESVQSGGESVKHRMKRLAKMKQRLNLVGGRTNRLALLSSIVSDSDSCRRLFIANTNTSENTSKHNTQQNTSISTTVNQPHKYLKYFQRAPSTSSNTTVQHHPPQLSIRVDKMNH